MVKGDRRLSLRSFGPASTLGAALALAVFIWSGTSTASAADAQTCGEAVVRDWTDGSIDRAYAADCYLAAIDALPEDVRTYTSAEDDITRALQRETERGARRALQGSRFDPSESLAQAERAQPNASASLRLPPLPVLLAVLLLVLLAGGLMTTAARSFRRRA
jgi:hypothetical protein